MANISQNTFNIFKSYEKVIFQQGVPITDYDLNEATDISKHRDSMLMESIGYNFFGQAGDLEITTSGTTYSVTVKGGSLISIGAGLSSNQAITINPINSYTISGTYPTFERVYFYMTLSTIEIDSTTDSSIKHPKLNVEPTRRIKVVPTITTESTLGTPTKPLYGVMLGFIEFKAGIFTPSNAKIVSTKPASLTNNESFDFMSLSLMGGI